MPEKKMVRLVSHSCALDVDVFSGLSVIINDEFLDSLKFAQNVRISKMYVQNLTSDIDYPKECTLLQEDVTWLYSAVGFKIENSLQNFANLTTLFIGGSSLNSPIFPRSKKNIIQFNSLQFFEISTAWAKHNILHPAERRYTFSDSTDDESYDYDEDEDIYFGENNQKPLKYQPPYSNPEDKLISDLEKAEHGYLSNERSVQNLNFSVATPVADNVFHLLSLICAPQIYHLRITYDDSLYNIGHLNWRDRPLQDFLKRHASTLEELILDGEQNDMENIAKAKTDILPLPQNLRYLFVNIAEYKTEYKNKTIDYSENGNNIATSSSNNFSKNSFNFAGFVKSLIGFKIDKSSSLWKELLRKQNSLEALHCTIYAAWGLPVILKCIQQSYTCLQVINIGCCWSPMGGKPLNMEIIARCLFLKKLTITILTSKETFSFGSGLDGTGQGRSSRDGAADESLESQKRCKIINLSALISCVMLESIFITCALCKTDDLDVLTSIPSLTCVVLLYVGRTRDYGVTVGLLEDLLHLRSLNLLIVVEFYRQKHSLHAHKLKKILQSEINTKECPIISCLAPYAGSGRFVYVGDINELRGEDAESLEDY